MIRTHAWYDRGIAHVAVGRYGDAINAYREVVRVDPERTVGWYSLGVNYASRRHKPRRAPRGTAPAPGLQGSLTQSRDETGTKKALALLAVTY